MFVHHRFSLNESTIETLKDMTPEFGYNGFGEFIFYRTYSRRKDQIWSTAELDNTYHINHKVWARKKKNLLKKGLPLPETIKLPTGPYEKWWETIVRVISGVMTIRKDWYLKNYIRWDEDFWQHYALHMARAMFKMEWLPPGRGLWAMGTEFIYERGSMALYNCFRGETLFLTTSGAVDLKSTVDKEVEVIDIYGKLRKAVVKKFNKQKLQRVIFAPYQINDTHHMSRSNLTLTFDVTLDHRWILDNGLEVTILQEGNKIRAKNTTLVFNKNSQDYIDGFGHGLIFADGTQQTICKNRYTIRLCEDHDNLNLKVLLKHSDFRTYCQPPSYNGDYHVTLVSNYVNYKELPISKSHTYLKGFFDAWLSCDAYLAKSGSYCLDSTNAEAIDWAINNCRLFNYLPTGFSTNNKPTNYGERNLPLNRLYLTNKDVTYKVIDIKILDKEEDVYCVVEPITKTFILAGGIPTGNCSATKITDDIADDIGWLMDSLMLGVGVGFESLRNDELEINIPRGSYEHIIDDSREGWVDGTRRLINSYTQGGPKPKLRYDEIRDNTEQITGFGGICSGPDPLIKFHNQIEEFFDMYGCEDWYDSVLLKTDLANCTGTCVVAG